MRHELGINKGVAEGINKLITWGNERIWFMVGRNNISHIAFSNKDIGYKFVATIIFILFFMYLF